MKIGIRALARVLSILLCASFVTAVYGQNSSFTGQVTDNTGAAIPKAAITVHNEGTGADITTQTSGGGDYSVPYLVPGSYTVTATVSGFSQAVQKGIPLGTDKTATINFRLVVGSNSERVVVESNPLLLDPGKADLSETMENEMVEDLPINGRSPGMLMELAPGANFQLASACQGCNAYQRPFDNPTAWMTISGGGNDFEFSADDQMMLDGTVNVEAGNGQTNNQSYQPANDSTAEVKVSTTPYDASYGKSTGPALEQTLKSGTNRIHGDLYDYAQRTFLNANTWQNDYYGSTLSGAAAVPFKKAGIILNEYGFELDGPVVIPKLYNGRDKTFFVAQFENWHDQYPSPQISSVPDPAWLTGNFSNLTNLINGVPQKVTIYDPATIHPVVINGSTVEVRDPFPGNIIPTNRLDPVALKLLSFYAAPNSNAPAGDNFYTNNLAITAQNPDIYRNWLLKVDQNLGGKDRISGRWAFWERGQSGIQPGVLTSSPACCWNTLEKTQNFAFDWVHTFSPTLILDSRATANTFHFGFPGIGTGIPYSPLWSSGVAAMLQAPTASSFPRFNLNGFSTIAGGGAPGGNTQNFLGVNPSVTWVKGKQTIRAGIDFRFNQNATTYANEVPNFNSTGNWTQQNYLQSDPLSGNSIADFLLGDLGGYNGVGIGGGVLRTELPFYSTHYLAFYGQDDWKITSKLTLNLGLRWDFDPSEVERHNRMNYAWDTKATNPVSAQLTGLTVVGGPTFAGVNGNPRSLYALNKGDIQPRLGVAYALNAKTVLRGGIGEWYHSPEANGGSLGYSITTNQIATVNGGITPFNTLDNPFPTIFQPVGSSQGLETQLGNSESYVNPTYTVPHSWNYTFGFERTIATHDTVSVNFVGNRVRDLDTSDNINRPSESFYAGCNLDLGATSAAYNACNNLAPANPFYNVAAFAGSPIGSAPTFQGNPAQLTRPEPEWGDITEQNLNLGHTWYNSLQVTGEHRWRNSLTLHGTYAWQKEMEAGGWKDVIYRVPFRSVYSFDIPQRVTVSGVYHLPVGRGHALLSNSKRLVDGALGGWEFGSIYIFQGGTPWAVPGGLNQLSSAKITTHSVPGSTLVQGVKACVAQWQQDPNTGNWSDNLLPLNFSTGCTAPNFQVVPGFGQTTNTSFSGIRIPHSQQFDANMMKTFEVHEQVKLQLRFEAFNAFNHPTWSISNAFSGSYGDPNFGTFNKVNGQQNTPRTCQLAAKIIW